MTSDSLARTPISRRRTWRTHERDSILGLNVRWSKRVCVCGVGAESRDKARATTIVKSMLPRHAQPLPLTSVTIPYPCLCSYGLASPAAPRCDQAETGGVEESKEKKKSCPLSLTQVSTMEERYEPMDPIELLRRLNSDAAGKRERKKENEEEKYQGWILLVG